MILKLIKNYQGEDEEDVKYIQGNDIRFYDMSFSPKELSFEEKFSNGRIKEISNIYDIYERDIHKVNFFVANVDGKIIKLMRDDVFAENKSMDFPGDVFWPRVYLMNDEGQTLEKIL